MQSSCAREAPSARGILANLSFPYKTGTQASAHTRGLDPEQERS